MPFRLCNALATFQRLKALVFSGLIGIDCLIYLDDIIIFGNTIGTRQGNVVGADAAAVIASVNNANQRNIQTNKNFNNGFVRRRKLYNYTFAANDDFHELEMFIPFTRIFSFCNEVYRILKYIPFEVVLTRTENNSHCYYGAANAAIDFSDHDSGITSLTLQLERIVSS